MRSLPVAMRDGVRLSTDVYLPKAGASRGWPTILIRTPYDKNRWRKAGDVRSGDRRGAARYFASHGYAVVVQDVRGKFESGGAFSVLEKTVLDYPDTMDWIVAQPWSSGRVGTFGCSYLGEIQYIQSALGHPALKATVPQAGAGAIADIQGRRRYFGARNGGAYELAMGFGWFWQNGAHVAPKALPERSPEIDTDDVLRQLPTKDLIRRNGGPPTDWNLFLTTSMDNPMWSEERGFVTDDSKGVVPGLHVNSWYDFGVLGTIDIARRFAENATNALAAENQYLLIGPGVHCANERAKEDTLIGDRSVGDARFHYWELYKSWFDRWLKGDENALQGLPKVQYYLMGANEWRAADRFPPTEAAPTDFFLSSDKGANGLGGDGALSLSLASGAGRDGFVYDPGDPVPSLGGPICCTVNADSAAGAFDQRPVESRSDVLVFDTEPLAEAVTVAGPIKVTLFVSSDAPDTDFTAKLVDVYPDGRAFNVQEGVLRARYRKGYDRTVFMESGEVYEIAFDLQATANQFKPGHQIRLEVSSSNFPRWDRNLNTGGNNYDETEWRTARNVIHHGPAYPSRLTLWTIKNN